MKKEIKNPQNAVELIIWKRWKHIVSVVRKIVGKKIQLLEKINKDRSMLLSNCTVCDKKRQDTLKIKNSFK